MKGVFQYIFHIYLYIFPIYGHIYSYIYAYRPVYGYVSVYMCRYTSIYLYIPLYTYIQVVYGYICIHMASLMSVMGGHIYMQTRKKKWTQLPDPPPRDYDPQKISPPLTPHFRKKYFLDPNFAQIPNMASEFDFNITF